MVKKKNIILLIIVILLAIPTVIFVTILGNKKDAKEKKTTKKTKVVEKKEQKGNSPEIKLLGREDYTIVVNGVYEEYGAIATDAEDGDISKNIKIDDSKFDVKKPGKYKISYSITDKDGNTSKVERNMNVIEVTDPDKDGIAVLMYHYFYDDENGETGKDGNYLALSMFKQQLNYFRDNNYYYPTMKELSKYLDGELELPSKSVIITMDDGAESNYRLAFPLAIEYKIPMTMFVVTSWTDMSGQLQQDMKNTGYMYFNSHTHNMHGGGCSGMGHGALIQCIDYNQGVQDMKTSKELLGTGDSMAYPCGDYNDHAISILKEAGYTLAFSTEFGKVKRGMNKLALPRVRVSDGNSLNYFIGCL